MRRDITGRPYVWCVYIYIIGLTSLKWDDAGLPAVRTNLGPIGGDTQRNQRIFQYLISTCLLATPVYRNASGKMIC